MPAVRVFHVVKPLPRFGSGSNPNPEPFQRVGTVANTNCKGNHIAKANVCVKKQEAIKTAREERRTWKEREGERRNVTTDQQKKPDQVEDGGPSTAEAEKKAPSDEQSGKEPEVQVVSTQVTTEQSSSAGTSETPMKQW